jgi:hypothetical protein
MALEDSYNIDDSLRAISERSLQRAMIPAASSPSGDSSPYSFLSQFDGGGVSTPGQGPAPSFEDYYGSSVTPQGGGMSSMYSSGKSYADYPTVPMPQLGQVTAPTLTAPELPTYTAPERDEKRRDALQTKAAAPGLTRLRRGLERGIQSTRSIDNPTERKFALSGMLEEFGLNLGDIISKADMTGLSEYEKEFSTQLDQAKTRYGAEVQGAVTDTSVANQNLMNQYQQQLTERNAKYALESQIFAKQPISRQAQSFKDSGTGLSRSVLSNRLSFR